MSTAEDDIYSPAQGYMPRGCELGTVGWASREEYVDFGTGANDGYTFVMVTLYAGKTPGDAPTAGLAQGREVLCSVNSLAGFRIPKKGTRVYVLFPAGMEDADGAGVIVAAVEKSATRDQFQKDRVVIDYGDDVHVVIKGLSVSLSDHDNRFMTVGTPRSGGSPGLIFQAKDGTGGTIQEGALGWFVALNGDAKSVLQMTPTSIELLQKDAGFVRLKNGAITTLSKGPAAYLAPGTIIGPTTVGALPAAMSPAGATVSTNVFIGV